MIRTLAAFAVRAAADAVTRYAENKKHAARAAIRRVTAPAICRWRNGADVAAALADGTLTTVTGVLASVGADEEFQRRYSSPAGKAIAKAYRTETGRDPVKIWTVRNGCAVHVYAYPAGDPAVTTGLAAYKRTAELVAA